MDRLIAHLFAGLLAFCFYCPGVQAQVSDSLPAARPHNPVQADSLRKARFVFLDSLNYRFLANGNFSRGNVDRSLLVLGGEINLQGPDISIATHPRFTYGEQNKLLAERDFFADLFIDVFKKRSLYAFALATVEKSNLRRIDWRQLAGAGIGLRLVQNSRHNLSLTNALIYESTNFRQRPTLTTHRNSTRLKGRHALLEDKVYLSHLTFWQPALSDFSNLRWNTLISLQLPINKWVALQATFENSYEKVVETSRKRNDTKLTFGISLGNLN